MFTKLPIDCLTNDMVDILKVSLIKKILDKWMYVINPWYYDLSDVPFDDDERLIAKRQIYRINNNSVERLNNGSIVDINMNQI